MQNQIPFLIHIATKSSNFYNNDPKFRIKTQLKLDKISKLCFERILRFLSITQLYVSFQSLLQNKGSFSSRYRR